MLDAPSFIVEREICRTDYAIDGRIFDKLFLSQMVANTESLALKPIIRPSHNPPANYAEQKSFGQVVGMWFAPSDKPGVEVLMGRLAFTEDAYSSYMKGEYPNCSIGPVELGTKPDGTIVGHYLEHLMLGGSQPVAFPNLKAEKSMEDNFFKRIANSLTQSIKDLVTSNPKDNPSMQTKEIILQAGKYDALMKAADALRAAISDLGMESQPPEKVVELEEPDKEKDKKESPGDLPAETMPEAKVTPTDTQAATPVQIAAAKQASDLLKREINITIRELQLPKDVHANFSILAEKIGVDAAKSLYATMQFQKPPQGALALEDRTKHENAAEKRLRESVGDSFDINISAAKERMGARINLVRPMSPQRHLQELYNGTQKSEDNK